MAKGLLSFYLNYFSNWKLQIEHWLVIQYKYVKYFFETILKQIGDIRNSLAHNSFMKLSEELFSKQLHTIKHVLVQIDLSEDLDDNHVFKMAQVRSSSIF